MTDSGVDLCGPDPHRLSAGLSTTVSTADYISGRPGLPGPASQGQDAERFIYTARFTKEGNHSRGALGTLELGVFGYESCLLSVPPKYPSKLPCQ